MNETLFTFARLVFNQCNGDLSDTQLRDYLRDRAEKILDSLEPAVDPLTKPGVTGETYAGTDAFTE